MQLVNREQSKLYWTIIRDIILQGECKNIIVNTEDIKYKLDKELKYLFFNDKTISITSLTHEEFERYLMKIEYLLNCFGIYLKNDNINN